MSAYIVSKKHIDVLVGFFQTSVNDWVIEANELGQLLWDENVRSVNYRYEEDTKPEKYTYEHPDRDYSPIEVMKLCDCLEYQSCETRDWRNTKAYRWLEVIRDNAYMRLPGYEEAAWSI